MDILMNAMKGRVSTKLDELVHQTDSPFTTQITSFPLPANFRIPQEEAYKRSKDLLDHLESFKTLIIYKGSQMKLFAEHSPPCSRDQQECGSVSQPQRRLYLQELSEHFVTHFIEGQRYKRSLASLLNIKQQEGESLRSCVTWFNKEAFLIDKANDKVLVTTFTSEL